MERPVWNRINFTIVWCGITITALLSAVTYCVPCTEDIHFLDIQKASNAYKIFRINTVHVPTNEESTQKCTAELLDMDIEEHEYGLFWLAVRHFRENDKAGCNSFFTVFHWNGTVEQVLCEDKDIKVHTRFFDFYFTHSPNDTTTYCLEVYTGNENYRNKLIQGDCMTVSDIHLTTTPTTPSAGTTPALISNVTSTSTTATSSNPSTFVSPLNTSSTTLSLEVSTTTSILNTSVNTLENITTSLSTQSTSAEVTNLDSSNTTSVQNESTTSTPLSTSPVVSVLDSSTITSQVNTTPTENAASKVVDNVTVTDKQDTSVISSTITSQVNTTTMENAASNVVDNVTVVDKLETSATSSTIKPQVNTTTMQNTASNVVDNVTVVDKLDTSATFSQEDNPSTIASFNKSITLAILSVTPKSSTTLQTEEPLKKKEADVASSKVTKRPKTHRPTRRKPRPRPEEKPYDELGDSIVPLVIGLVIGVLCLVLIIAVVIVKCRDREEEKRKESEAAHAKVKPPEPGSKPLPPNVNVVHPQMVSPPIVIDSSPDSFGTKAIGDDISIQDDVKNYSEIPEPSEWPEVTLCAVYGDIHKSSENSYDKPKA